MPLTLLIVCPNTARTKQPTRKTVVHCCELCKSFGSTLLLLYVMMCCKVLKGHCRVIYMTDMIPPRSSLLWTLFAFGLSRCGFYLSSLKCSCHWKGVMCEGGRGVVVVVTLVIFHNGVQSCHQSIDKIFEQGEGGHHKGRGRDSTLSVRVESAT